MLRWETKRRIWSLSRIRVWHWWPDCKVGKNVSVWSFIWLCWWLEGISKEWLDYCERKGFGMRDAIEFVLREVDGESNE